MVNSTERYKDFPPGWGHIKVPMSSRRAALAGLTLYTPCLARGVWAQRAARACVATLGPRALPGRSFPWVPMSDVEWLELLDAWRRELGAFDDVAGYSRLQTSRTGLALLLLHKGTPIAFVKLRQGDCVSLSNERRAVEAVWSYRPRAFQVPEPFLSASAGGWRYLASAPLTPGLHRPPRNPPLRAIREEVEAALAQIPRPMGTPEHWRPMHGDFAPWNLRQILRNPPFLIDWENAGWAPPHADEVFYRAIQAALGGHPATAPAAPVLEAIRFWQGRLKSESGNARDRRLWRALKEVFASMESRSTMQQSRGRDDDS